MGRRGGTRADGSVGVGPFLKWAGGKGQLLDAYAASFPAQFGAYHEPFLGGGAVFFELARAGRVRHAALSDVNAALVRTYRVVRDATEPLLRVLTTLRANHDEAHYYEARRRFNEDDLDDVTRAALLIYLNKTGFNGLYRVNAKGHFNVPFGRYVEPRVFDPDHLRAVATALVGVELLVADFGAVIERAKAGDFVYFDPPYVPLSTTAFFTAYAREGFGPAEQSRLAELFRALDGRGVRVMLSNHDTPELRALYAGFELQTVPARRSINSRADRRGSATAELIVRNYR